MRWLAKAAVQGVLSQLPASQRWNYWFQRNAGTLSVTPAYILEKMSLCAQHLSAFRRFSSGHPLPQSVLEIGSGWLPIVPVGLYLATIPRIYTIDIQALSNPALLSELVHTLTEMPFNEIARVLPDAQESRFIELMSLSRQTGQVSLNQLNISTIVGDARKMSFESGSMDCIVSNSTLEHIPGPVIAAIFDECHRVLAAHGLMSHLIDMQDHYSYFDQSLTVYHFLQHGDVFWRLVNNKLQYQNRLRVSDHRALHEQASFEIVEEQTDFGDISLLRQMKLAPAFRHYPAKDLAATQSWIWSRPTPKLAQTIKEMV